MSPGKNYDFDVLFADRKTFGSFQIRQLCILLLSWTSIAFVLLEIVFLGYIPDYQCKDLTNKQLYKYNVTINDNINYDKCHIHIERGLTNNTETIGCINGHNYSTDIDISFATEWNLVCDRDGLAELTQSLFTVGQGIGALVFTSFADKYGRKPIHVGCTLLLFLSATGSSFSPNIWVFSALRVLSGAFQQGSIIPGYTMGLELFPANKRTLMSFVLGVWWGICVMILALIAYLMQHTGWRWLCAVFGLPGIISIVEIWYLKESIRWLFAKGKIDKAEKIVKYAANINGVNFPGFSAKEVYESEKLSEDLEEKETLMLEEIGTKNEQGENEVKEVIHNKESAVGMWTLMKYRKIRNITLVNMYTWLITSLTYFGLYLTSGSLSGNRHLNYFLTASMEIPSSFILYKLFMLYGRKKGIIILITTSAVSLLAVSLMKSLSDSNEVKIASIVCSLIGMIGVSGAFGGLWLYTPEIYPTTLRNAGMGVCSATARLGSMISPFTRLLAAYVVWGPGLVFGAGCFIASALFFILPETHNKQLPQNLDDMLKTEQKPNKNKK
ncbi:organic cation transporter-like protein [Argonauta hians]